jgi:8-oxo-dGTP pyrophosphatase MutT (NUDIX family)
MNSVKVYFNHHCHLLITYVQPDDTSIYQTVLADEQAVWDFRANPSILWDEHSTSNILLLTGHVDETLESLFNYAEGIVAAGGLVKNSAGETLVIYRRGYWDLPKGKVEKGEQIIHAAAREVTEETGVAIATTLIETTHTYHCYTLHEQSCIKETYWYTMQPAGEQEQLVPQTTEDIDQVLWMSYDRMKAIKAAFYPMIADLLGL